MVIEEALRFHRPIHFLIFYISKIKSNNIFASHESMYTFPSSSAKWVWDGLMMVVEEVLYAAL